MIIYACNKSSSKDDTKHSILVAQRINYSHAAYEYQQQSKEDKRRER